MAFMVPEIWEADFYTVETNHGTEIVPVEASGTVATVGELRDYLEGDPYDPDETPELHHGFIARMSAPGYMDCTAWTAFESLEEAETYLREFEEVCPMCGEDLPEDSEDCLDCDGEE